MIHVVLGGSSLLSFTVLIESEDDTDDDGTDNDEDDNNGVTKFEVTTDTAEFKAFDI